MSRAILGAVTILLVTAMVAGDATVVGLGRMQLTPQGGAHFDHPGTAVSLRVHDSNQSSIDVYVTLKALTSDNSTMNQPHQFQAFLFDSVKSWQADPQRPPPLSWAVINTTFNTSQWTSNESTTVPLFHVAKARSFVIWIIKITEADFNRRFFAPNYVTFINFQQQFGSLGSSTHVFETRESRLSTKVPRRAPRRMEFIGDSITAGYCNKCVPAPGDNADHDGFLSESFLHSWAYLTAEYFGAEYHTAAWSGFGLVRNCCGGDVEMPEIFRRTVATTSAWPWNFTRPTEDGGYRPDAIVINLGSNDHLDPTTPGPVEKQYVQTYVSLLRNVTAAYARDGRTLHAFLACGPMVPIEGYLPYVLEVIDRAQAIRGLKAHFLNLTVGLPAEDTCCGHPNVHGDIILAGRTIPVVADAMRWKGAYE